jgi:hypothetical protein
MGLFTCFSQHTDSKKFIDPGKSLLKMRRIARAETDRLKLRPDEIEKKRAAIRKS